LLKAIVKPPKPAEKPKKEKKLNYNQIEKMKRIEQEQDKDGAIIVTEENTETK
jgi:hypothetical protein